MVKKMIDVTFLDIEKTLTILFYFLRVSYVTTKSWLQDLCTVRSITAIHKLQLYLQDPQYG